MAARMKLLLAWIAALSIGGCATMQPAAAPTLYDRIGGRAALTAVVDDAIENVSADPRINRRFANAGPGLTKNLVDLLCLRAGGPCKYAGLDMAAAHEGMFINDDEFDALVEDIGESIAILRQMRNAIVGH